MTWSEQILRLIRAKNGKVKYSWKAKCEHHTDTLFLTMLFSDPHDSYLEQVRAGVNIEGYDTPELILILGDSTLMNKADRAASGCGEVVSALCVC